MPKTVLIVEDHPDTRTTMARLVEMLGFAAETAANGREALDLLRGGLSPCLVLLDLMMPVMDGWTFLQERAKDPSLQAVPVVITSALNEVPSGAAAAVGKPVEIDALHAVVRRYC